MFKHLFASVVLRHRLGDRPRHALHFQSMQYRGGFTHVVDALIEFMLNRRMATPKFADPNGVSDPLPLIQLQITND